MVVKHELSSQTMNMSSMIIIKTWTLQIGNLYRWPKLGGPNEIWPHFKKCSKFGLLLMSSRSEFTTLTLLPSFFYLLFFAAFFFLFSFFLLFIFFFFHFFFLFLEISSVYAAFFSGDFPFFFSKDFCLCCSLFFVFPLRFSSRRLVFLNKTCKLERESKREKKAKVKIQMKGKTQRKKLQNWRGKNERASFLVSSNLSGIN